MTHNPRISAIAPEDETASEVLAKALRIDGVVLNAASTLAHHPRLLKRFTIFAGHFLSHSLLPERDRELITLRCTHRFDSEYYFGHHALLAREVLSPEEIARTVEPAARWSGCDRRLLEIVDELADTANLSDPSWSDLAVVYDDRQLLDLVMLVGFYRMTCQYANTVSIRREPGVPGWPAERTRP